MFAKRLAGMMASALLASTCLADDNVQSNPQLRGFTYAEASEPAQIPICMIGDSITWAMNGDYWRKYLVERFPNLAFVGTHSAVLGYSHAGEGGNSCEAVLARLDSIPDCPYFSLLIGTNNNGVKDEASVKKTAEATAGKIQAIVERLLDKPGVKKVFLGSILPCHTSNPLRDRTNSETNILLRERFGKVFPTDKVVWVEYENTIRGIDGWEPLIELHPTQEGYRIPAKILGDALAAEFKDSVSRKVPVPKPGAGVRVDNLWSEKDNCTATSILPGWYTVSFDVLETSEASPSVEISSLDPTAKFPLKRNIELAGAKKGTRSQVSVFTDYEGYGYTKSKLAVKAVGCKIDKILFEKMRPSGKASIYGEGSYIDAASPFSPGELLEIGAGR